MTKILPREKKVSTNTRRICFASNLSVIGYGIVTGKQIGRAHV